MPALHRVHSVRSPPHYRWSARSQRRSRAGGLNEFIAAERRFRFIFPRRGPVGCKTVSKGRTSGEGGESVSCQTSSLCLISSDVKLGRNVRMRAFVNLYG